MQNAKKVIATNEITHIDRPLVLLAAFAACLERDSSGALRIDFKQRDELLKKIIAKEEKNPSANPLYRRLTVSEVLITSKSWYRTPQLEEGVSPPVSYDELEGYVDPNYVLLVLERHNGGFSSRGFQLLGGADPSKTDAQIIAADSVIQKLSTINRCTVPDVSTQMRNHMECRFSNLLVVGQNFLASAILSREKLQELSEKKLLTPHVIEFYEACLRENESRASTKAKEISSLDIPSMSTFAWELSEEDLQEWVHNDQRFYHAKDERTNVRTCLIHLLDALYPEVWLGRGNFYKSIVPELYHAVNKNEVIFKAYLRQATSRIMQLMRADILRERWPSPIGLNQSVMEIYQQWLSHSQIDFEGYFKRTHSDFKQEYVEKLGMTTERFSAFLLELSGIVDLYKGELLGLIAAKLGRESDQYPVTELTLLHPSQYWGADAEPSGVPRARGSSQSTPPCNIIMMEETTLNQQMLHNRVLLGQCIYVVRTEERFYVEFRLQRGGIGRREITAPALMKALLKDWAVGEIIPNPFLITGIVNTVIVAAGGCYPARHVTTAPMQEKDRLKQINREKFLVDFMVDQLSVLLGDGRYGDYTKKSTNFLTEKVLVENLNATSPWWLEAHEVRKLEALNALYTTKMLPDLSSLYTHTSWSGYASAKLGLFSPTNTFNTQLETSRKCYVSIVETTAADEKLIKRVEEHLSDKNSLINTNPADHEKVRAIIVEERKRENRRACRL